jgi:Co/Zn/Cd efflux system component
MISARGRDTAKDATFGTMSKPLLRSVFAVPKMDCPSEENLVRMALQGDPACVSLDFDLTGRRLTVVHSGSQAAVLQRLEALNLGTTHVSSAPATISELQAGEGDRAEGRILKILLAINAAMFVLELALGFLAESTGLIADSLDMFADAAVYGLALYAVGRSGSTKIKAAHFAGRLQVLLALGALVEVIRRFFTGSEPQSTLMMGVGLLALVANVVCLLLIAGKRHRGVHMKASYIFSANDVIANAGVIVAGALVAWTASPYPDLIIGSVIAMIVLNGGRRILSLRE